jgi:acyl-CoA thioesterase
VYRGPPRYTLPVGVLVGVPGADLCQTPGMDPHELSDDLSHVLAMWADDRASRDLGMKAEVIEVDHAVVRMAVTGSMVNGHAIAHGGFIFTLADSAFALACNSRGSLTVAAGADVTFVTSARLGDVLVADARQRTTYGRSGITDVTVTRESDGAVVAEFRGRSRSLPPR